ncbi:MAG: T9SS type A sorting domain-containing protein [Flavobacteriaceae bacterium]|nr:T9SS type A sorting domain-containing protein [Flavobacteriaceae bacterium]
MKFCITLLLIAFTCLGFSQNFEEDQSAIMEAEMKSASTRINYRVNPNTGNYDIKYHKLDFTINPSVASISGIVTTHFEAKENMSSITFDLTDNMNVSKVLQNGSPVSYSQNTNDELVINLTTTVNQGETGIVEVTYSGAPQFSGFDSFEASTHSGDPVLWTLSEPYGAKDWWPCKQDLNDKIDSIDIYITTPRFNSQSEEYVAVSNGLEQSISFNGSNKTTHFKHNFPIPAYLVAIAATNYSVFTQTVPNNGNPFEIVNYVYPETLASAQVDTAVTLPIMELFSNLFEEYPYASEKYGHAQFGWGGGMEHTTVSFMGNFSRNLIAHELAHQWFGDKITCGSWKDIWLNEGFATYLSGLVIEDIDGNAAFTSWKQGRINNITSQPGGAVYLSDQDTTNVGRIFSGRLSYNKGSMVLHMLRKKLGETDFYQGIQDYLNDPDLAFGYAKTEDLKSILENASGEDLTEFFDDWVYNEGYPSYNIEWSQPNPSQVQIQIDQTQSHSSVNFFEAPIKLRLNGVNSEKQYAYLNHTSNGQVFLESVTFEVDNIQFDPESDLISRNNSVVLGLSDSILDVSFVVYPNPAHSEVFIQKPNDLIISKIEILDLLGRKVKEMLFESKISIELLSSGLHFLKFETNKGTIHKRLLKQ